MITTYDETDVSDALKLFRDIRDLDELSSYLDLINRRALRAKVEEVRENMAREIDAIGCNCNERVKLTGE